MDVVDTDRFYTHLLTSSRSEHTAKTYVANFKVFDRWCRAHEMEAATAERETVQAYLAEELLRLGRNSVALRLSGLHAYFAFIGRREVTQDLSVNRELLPVQALQ